MITGLTLNHDDVRDIISRFRALDEAVRKRVARAAIKKIATRVADRIRPKVPTRSGTLRRSLFVAKTKRKKDIVSGYIGFRRGGKGGEDPSINAPYASFLEHGSRAYYFSGKYQKKKQRKIIQRGRVHNNRRSKRKNTWNRYWASSIPSNTKDFIDQVDLEMDKVIRRLARKPAWPKKRPK